MFTSRPDGAVFFSGVLCRILLTRLTAHIEVGFFVAAICGWLFRRTTGVERILLIVAGVILVYPNAVVDVMVITLAAGVAFWQWRTQSQHGYSANSFQRSAISQGFDPFADR